MKTSYDEYKREIEQRIVDLERVRDGLFMQAEEYQKRIQNLQEMKRRMKEQEEQMQTI